MVQITDSKLLAFVDGTLSDSEKKQIEQCIATNPELEQKIQQLQASSLPYKQAYRLYEKESQPPQTLITSIHSVVHRQPNSSVWLHNLMPWAAMLVIGLVLGYITAVLNAPASQQQLAADRDDVSFWVESVASYQSLYVRATVMGASGDKKKAQQLLQAIDAGEHFAPQIPDLTGLGYTFKRAQQLGYMGEPLVQLVYLKSDGVPLALCFMLDANKGTQVRVGQSAGLGTVDWRRGNHRFVIVADESESRLRSLSNHVIQSWL